MVVFLHNAHRIGKRIARQHRGEEWGKRATLRKIETLGAALLFRMKPQQQEKQEQQHSSNVLRCFL